VNSTSGIEDVSSLKGKRFAFGNELSTIGRYLSQLYLVEHGITSNDLSNHEYLGRHDTVGMAVALNKFDAGALKESTFKKIVAAGKPIKAIASFPNVTKPWIAKDGITERVFSSLQKALINMKDEASLKSLKKAGFLEGSDRDYDTIRKSMQENGRFFDRTK